MSDFREEEPQIINAVDIEKNGNELTFIDESGKKIILTLTDGALAQLPDVLPRTSESVDDHFSKKQRTSEYNMESGGSRRRKSRKHKVVKRRNKSHRRHRH